MKTVYKYPFEVSSVVKFSTFEGAKLLKVGVQSGTPCAWLEVDTEAQYDVLAFYIFGTGHEIPGGLKHVTTFFDEPFVWHVYRGDDEKA